MGCCDSDSVRVSKMALELKSGPMLWHKRRFFGSNWRDVYSVLYNDSSLLWFRDKTRQEQEGGLVLKEAPELIAFGPYTSAVPDRPPLPDNYEQKELLAFGVRGKDVVFWFLCPNQEEVASWMSAIGNTLPPPPAPPQPPQASAPDEGMPAPQQQMPTPQYAPPQAPPPQYAPNQHVAQPSYVPQAAPAGIPGQYPTPMSYRPPPYQGYNTVRPQPYPVANGGGGTTVVVQQDRPGYAGGGGGGDFAMGMLMGGALGTAWGSHHYGGGWGVGGGWGGGWGPGHGPSVTDTDININNTIVNNNFDMTSNTAIEQHAPVASDAIMSDFVPPEESAAVMSDFVPEEDVGGGMFDGGDFDGGDFGGGDFGGGDFGDF